LCWRLTCHRRVFFAAADKQTVTACNASLRSFSVAAGALAVAQPARVSASAHVHQRKSTTFVRIFRKNRRIIGHRLDKCGYAQVRNETEAALAHRW
jgi:hypothetical protein